ncbi:pseudouridylate synthase RPUSD2 isoform X3 [Lepeophtheirus salmonis]|uniref:pseudouridylate synthase RPUSD2 isoform X3 n=1 Tax=Lepeophtheirus salmonis TaxID=72036 RepID=UPI001AEAFD90|nr:RNA pseudouridylate synthase domain-containing protein 2-like isoform X1 [Lepeophtheirus salmonis]
MGKSLFEVHTFDRSNKRTKVSVAKMIEEMSEEEIKNVKREFFKKNPETSHQKKIKCLACTTMLESILSWSQHVEGAKHRVNVEAFNKDRSDLCTPLKDLFDESTDLFGLEMIVEYRFPSEPYQRPPYYECKLISCPKSSASAFAFQKHLLSEEHKENYSNEKLIHEGNSDWSKMKIVVDDEEKYRKLALGYDKDLRSSNPHNFIPSSNAPSSSVSSTSPSSKRKLEDIPNDLSKSDVKKAKLETKALKAKRPGFTDERYNETTYYHDSDTKLRKVYPYYFTFTTFTKGRWVGEKILEVFAREFRAHPAEEYERCIKAGTLTVNYEKVDTDYRLKHNDLLANIVHRHEVPVSSERINIIHMDDELVVVNKPASIPVHPCGRYRHNTVVFILAKEYGLKNLRTIHRLDRLTSGLLLFGRNPKKAREMEQQIRTRQCRKEYVCRVEGEFPKESIICKESIEVISYKIGVCKVSPSGKDCHTEFQRLSYNGQTSVVLCKPHTGRMHQIRVHLQFLGYPVINDPLYNHAVFGPLKGKGGNIGKTDDELIQDLIFIHNAENWLGIDDNSPSAGSPSNFLLGPNKVSPDATPISTNPSLNGSNGTTKDNTINESGCGGSSTVVSNVSKATSTTIDNNISSSFNTNTQTTEADANPPPPSDCNGKNAPRVDTPDSAVDMMSSTADSPVDNFSSDGGSSCVNPSCIKDEDEEEKVTTATQTGFEEADNKFNDDKMTYDTHCYECKVKYRDPKPKDLIMYLHAVTYSGPGWKYSTELPDWADENWEEVVYED